MTYQQERADFTRRIVNAKPADMSIAQAEHAAALLMRHATTHNRIQEIWCNVEMSERMTKYWEKREQQLERRMKEIATGLNMQIDFTGDPRGYTTRVFFPDNSYNTWGGVESGFGVPVRTR